jgi:TetR/AcrR family transcriptional repressor of nem operon
MPLGGELANVKHFDPDVVLATVERLFWERGMGSTGIADVVAVTGINRSSLYATFGGKQELYVAALRRYVDLRSRPVFDRLAGDGRGLPAIEDFFAGLIRARCSGEYARWGCMVSNAHAGAERDDPDVRKILHEHHKRLRAAMHTALLSAPDQLRPHIDPAAAAGQLALLAYGVNLRSRAGAGARSLLATVTGTLDSMRKEIS